MTLSADSPAYPVDKTLVDLFTEQVGRTPDNTAVTFGNAQLTYLELDTRSTQLAHYLQRLGVTEETLVPICLERSIDLVVGVLGILKAGGVYVPIDPDYPADRIAYMLADLNASVLVTDRASCAMLEQARPTLRLVCLDDPEQALQLQTEPVHPVITRLEPGNLAYIIYTSGSTGKPKGVQIEHASVVSLLKPAAPIFDFTEHDVWTMFHSFCFDFSVWEMYGALLFGGRLVMVPKHVAKDAVLFAALLEKEQVTVLNQTPSAFYVLQEQLASQPTRLPVRYVVFGGEALNPARLKPWKTMFPNCQLINMYGITETTVHVTYLALTSQHLTGTTSLIGRAIPTLSTYVLDSDQQPVAVGETGELYVGGAGLARGYLNQPDLTTQRFINQPSGSQTTSRLYRSGDLVRLLDGGDLEYLGRIDEQVKIRGYRIELGEIEHALHQYPGVKQAVVVAKTVADADVRLVGYVVADGAFQPKDLTAFLGNTLPNYMIPSQLTAVDSIPLTSNGKADRRALLGRESQAKVSAAYAAPGNPTEEKLIAIWKKILAVDRIGVHDNFFELGGNSLLAVRTMAALKEVHAQAVPVTKLYQFPTVRTLAGYLDGQQQKPVRRQQQGGLGESGDVAVIGMAGRFPGASTIDALWEVLRNGRETVHFFSDNELDPTLPAALTRDPAYVKARGILAQADQFDPAFFGLTPKLAEVMDPQQRIFLEIAWEALEQSGYLPQQYGGSIGVWAGCGNNTYYLNNVLANQPVVNQVGSFQAMTVNEKDFIASRTAYQLNLNGPAVSVYSACSTSLLAITQAVDSIRLGHCDLALAGGASVTAPIQSGHLYEVGAMLSKDGHCRPFDAGATGTVFSDGAGVVLLKSRQAAERDGDLIFAVIKGVGVNNDGGGKGSFTAPNAEGQAGAIRMALTDARVDADTLSYIEAHGTATPLGDPIEIDGLSLAFGEGSRKQFCALGSIKSNMGHLTAAAGVAGLIKTTLALYHRQLPASIGYHVPNPVINFADSPFYVNATHTDWISAGPRRAGVSSFGVGGTNVHVVLEEFSKPESTVEQPVTPEAHRPVQLVTWSAKSERSLTTYATDLADYLRQHTALNVPDVAYTLQRRNPSFAHRRFVLAGSREALLASLAPSPTPDSPPRSTSSQVGAPEEIVFLFPGQGAQYVNMGRSLYECEPVYKEAVDTCANHLRPHLDTDIREILYPAITDQTAHNRLTDTRFTQPALFTTEYALARLWQSWGVEPTVFCGHSIGEFVAAHLAGVFSLSDALLLVARRGTLISSLPGGDMLSVRLPADRLQALLPPTLSLAVVNSRTSCVVAGPTDAIASFSAYLTEQTIANRLLETSHAFHSAMIDPIVDEFEEIVRGVSLNRPTKPIVSTVTGSWLTDADATNPHYWASHMRATVQFADALETLFTLPKPIFLETGPGTVTSALARQQAAPRPVDVVASLDTGKGNRTDYESMLNALGQLWIKGINPDWAAFSSGQKGRQVMLPTYAFDRKRCWVNPAHQQTDIPVNQEVSQSDTASIIRHSDDTITMRKTHLLTLIYTLLNETSGIEASQFSASTSFLEMGLDSLILTQFSYTVRKKFNLPISFRQLNNEFSTPQDLVAYLDRDLPADAFQPAVAVVQPTAPVTAPGTLLGPKPINGFASVPIHHTTLTDASSPLVNLIEQQLQIMAQQLAALRGHELAPSAPVPEPVAPAIMPPPAPVAKEIGPVSTDKVVVKQAFGAGARIERQASALNPTQKEFLQQLTDRYTRKTAASKQYTQEHRRYMADPRVVTGFRPMTKELVYPIVVDKSKGSRLWDIDGNEYIDALNGFGSNMLGYQPEVLKTALHDQIEKGYELGPQHKLAGDVTRMLCEFTGFDRAALCNTGSEAVLGALRMARTVTGRSLVVTFAGSYHGIFDEVISRGGASQQATPAALGIPTASVQNILILDYGTDESLQIIRERAHELAAVLVEPVQSRRPEFQPIDFLKQVRAITEASETALIFDEVITGFRMHPGGAQALFGIRADLATYGKVIGGGLPIGVVAGKAQYMDALDGGFWQYGDDSYPQADLTFFAGTFVRHPLVLAAAMASLEYMREQGPALQERLTAKAKQLADSLNLTLAKLQLPLSVGQFGSLWKLKFTKDVPYGELLFTLMREKGIHIWDGFPCFMTEAHTSDDINRMAQAFTESVQELINAQFLVPKGPPLVKLTEVFTDLKKPPVPDARLGRDRQGNPAWFVADPKQPGTYLQLA